MAYSQEHAPRDNREWFLYYLFTDPDFINEKGKINADIQALVDPKAYGLMFLMQDQSISDWLVKQGKNGKVISDRIKALGDKYEISTTTTEQGLRYTNKLFAISHAFRFMPSVNVEDDQVVIRLNGKMRLKDIKDAYPNILRLQKTLPDYEERNRSRDRPDLIYSIYKQRLKGLSFKQIYGLYEVDRLPGYKGARSITGEESLARTYWRFKPDI